MNQNEINKLLDEYKKMIDNYKIIEAENINLRKAIEEARDIIINLEAENKKMKQTIDITQELSDELLKYVKHGVYLYDENHKKHFIPILNDIPEHIKKLNIVKIEYTYGPEDILSWMKEIKNINNMDEGNGTIS